jgi:hypothetical protein
MKVGFPGSRPRSVHDAMGIPPPVGEGTVGL